jgi:CBS domain-containing protein
MTVEQVMKRNPRCCSQEDTLEDAARVMWEQDCGIVPVVDAERRLVGMISDRDVCMAAYFQSVPLRELLVRDAMSREVMACRPRDSLTELEAIMRRARVRRVPVIDERGAPIGIVSLNDIALEAARTQRARAPEVSLQDVALTLSAISEHRHEHATPRE